MLRYFSSAGYIINKTRSSLDQNTVNMLVCLRDWMDAQPSMLTLKFQFSIHINNFELTGDPFKLVKLYNLCSLI